MAMDAKARKKRTIQIAAGVIIFLVIGLGAILLFSGGEPEAPPASLGPSDSMVPGNPETVESDNRAEIIANPNAINFLPGEQSQTFTLLATGAPVLIEDVRIPSEYAATVQPSSVDCPPPTMPLSPGQSCTVNVSWDGVTPFSTAIEVVGKVFNLEGNGQTITARVAVAAQDSGVPSGIGGLPTQGGFGETSVPVEAADGTYAPVDAAPVETAPVTAAAPAPAQPSLRQQQRDAYLSARRQGSLAGIRGGQLNATAKSTYTSWNNIGATGNVSSYPTDMSRVITPDKAITAVISVPIDTRNPVTAIAMVDRDVYGNNGRTVVIPRGSKLIGTPGVSDTRVGIAWKQLIRPDGTRFMLEASSGDAMGRGGVPGRVNERLLQRYGFSLIPNIVSAGLTAALGGQSTDAVGVAGATQTKDARAVAAEILSEPLNQIAQDIYQRKANLPIQIRVPAGTRITVWSLNDLRLKPMGEKEKVEGENPRDQQQRNGNRQNVELPTEVDRSYGSGTSTPRSNDGPEGDEDLGNYGVGRIDENGNYIAPGSRAPSPSTAPLSRTNER